MAAAPTRLVEPPLYDPPIVDYASGQRHSQAWTEYHQSVSDRLSANTAAISARAGVTDAAEATPGQIGEYLAASGSGVGLSNGTAANVVTLALTAGDWDVEGNVQFVSTGTVSRVTAGVSTVSGAWDHWATSISGTLGTGGSEQIGTGGAVRVIVAAPTTAYLVAASAFSTGGVTANGVIFARRMR